MSIPTFGAQPGIARAILTRPLRIRTSNRAGRAGSAVNNSNNDAAMGSITGSL